MKFDPLHASQNSLTTALVCLEPRSLLSSIVSNTASPTKKNEKRRKLTP